VDATEQPVYRSQDNEERKRYYSGKKKAFTLKTEFVTDGQHHVRQLSTIRVRVEHCIGWVKNWAIIATRFRCAHSIYTLILRVICGFVNIQTERWQMAKARAAARLARV
jgi:hypothetical protein